MFIHPAFADTATQSSDVMTSIMATGLLPQIVLIIAVFYVLLIRPQQKKMRMHLEMVTALRRGDRVITSGGIIGTITRVIDDKEALVEIASGVEVRVLRSTIADILTKSPVSASDANDQAA